MVKANRSDVPHLLNLPVALLVHTYIMIEFSNITLFLCKNFRHLFRNPAFNLLLSPLSHLGVFFSPDVPKESLEDVDWFAAGSAEGGIGRSTAC